MDKGLLIQWAIAKVVRTARKKLDISQELLALTSGLSYPFISEVERGLTSIGIDALLQLAEALHVDAWKLMRRIETELRRGPKPPEKIHGRPPKAAKKEKTSEPGDAGQRRGRKAVE